MFINKEELLEAIKRKYGNLNDECGCSVFVNGDWEWLSVKDIVDVINDCTEYDDEGIEIEYDDED